MTMAQYVAGFDVSASAIATNPDRIIGGGEEALRGVGGIVLGARERERAGEDGRGRWRIPARRAPLAAAPRPLRHTARRASRLAPPPGDASEQTFTFYFAQNMRAHRLWASLVPPCLGGCAGNHTDAAGRVDTGAPGFVACADACWARGEAAHELVRLWRRGAGLGRGGRLC
jgi:hypothetical protein